LKQVFLLKKKKRGYNVVIVTRIELKWKRRWVVVKEKEKLSREGFVIGKNKRVFPNQVNLLFAKLVELSLPSCAFLMSCQAKKLLVLLSSTRQNRRLFYLEIRRIFRFFYVRTTFLKINTWNQQNQSLFQIQVEGKRERNQQNVLYPLLPLQQEEGVRNHLLDQVLLIEHYLLLDLPLDQAHLPTARKEQQEDQKQEKDTLQENVSQSVILFHVAPLSAFLLGLLLPSLLFLVSLCLSLLLLVLSSSLPSSHIVQQTVRQMMFGFGDRINPLPQSVELMEELVLEYITQIVSLPLFCTSSRLLCSPALSSSLLPLFCPSSSSSVFVLSSFSPCSIFLLNRQTKQ
jgi:hypothetical protein